jgi:hypothetical protein
VGTFRPKFLPESLTAYNLPGLLQQQTEYAERLVLEFESIPLASQRASTEVCFKKSEANGLPGVYTGFWQEALPYKDCGGVYHASVSMPNSNHVTFYLYLS